MVARRNGYAMMVVPSHAFPKLDGRGVTITTTTILTSVDQTQEEKETIGEIEIIGREVKEQEKINRNEEENEDPNQLPAHVNHRKQSRALRK